MTSAAPNYRDLTVDEIKDALNWLSPNMPRPEWVRVGMALQSELPNDEAFRMFDDWSRGGENYSANDVRDTWRTFKGAGTNIATLIGLALAEGFRFNDEERKPLSQEEIDARQAKREAEAAARKAEKDKAQAEALLKAAAYWNAGVDVEADEHAYLERKGVLGYGLRIGKYRGIERALLIPIRNKDGELTSLQAIFEGKLLVRKSKPGEPPREAADRDYLWNGQKMNGFHMIGDKPAGSQIVIGVCEGYATGATAHMATGWSVAVAFDSNNLRNVAAIMRELYPQAQIVIIADDDRWHDDPNKVNSGIHYAHQAAQACIGFVAAPKFADTSSKPTDFNDLHQLEGIDAVRAQLKAALPKVKADNDNDPEPAYPLDSPIDYRSYPHTTDKGVVLNTVENLEWMLDMYGITARYNQTRKSVEVKLPGRHYTLDNEANCALAELSSICARNRMPKSELPSYIKLISDRNAYNPVCDWITSKPWDGVKRIQSLLDTIHVDGDPTLKNQLIYRWLLSAVASVFQPFGFEGHGCLVFTGPQGIGKTTWFKRLAPLDARLVLLGATLDPADKDSKTTALSHWIVELGELDATFRKADIARLKSFIPKPKDELRRPYDRVDSEYQRRTVFCASVNDDRYLVDDTGNRRWWTIAVVRIDYRHDIDMQQVWAELLLHFQRGEQYHLTPEENDGLGEVNKEHEMIDSVEELILSRFHWDEPLRPSRMTATEVLIAIGYDKPTKQQATHGSKILKKITGGGPKKSGSSRFFEMPKLMGRSGRGFVGDDEIQPPL